MKTYFSVVDKFFVCEDIDEQQCVTIVVGNDVDMASITSSRFPSFKAGSKRIPITKETYEGKKKEALEIINKI